MQRNFTFSLLAFFISLSSLIFAQMPEMQIVGSPKKMSSEIVGRRDVNGKFCAAIQIQSNLKGLTYDSNNGVVGNIARKPGLDLVYLSANERLLEVYHSEHKSLRIFLLSEGINLKPKEVWRIEIKGQAKTGDLLPVTIHIQPKNSTITIDKKTYKSGSAIKLSKGQHKISVSKEGFKTTEKTINVSESNVYFNYSLGEVELEQVLIKSIPTEVRIYVNSVDEGLTDRGIWKYPGQYQLKLSKTGYAEINKKITVTEGPSTSSGQALNIFSYTLTKNSGSLQLTVAPTNVSVLINKKDYTSTSSVRGSRIIELAPGRYKIELSKTDYYLQSETITVERGQTLNRNYTLIAKTGKLQFNIQPLSAKVTLKQNGQTLQNWKGMKYLKNLQVGSYDLECTASGYGTEIKRITIEEQQTAIADIKLKKGSALSLSKGVAGTMTDQDGNVYKTVLIGNQLWMAENLKVTRYRNGDAIPNVTGKNKWENLKTGAYCNYDNNSSNVSTYGRLYNWYAVNDRRKIAPAGWHLPTDEEWKQLEMYLGMSQSKANETGWRGSDEGGKLKERGTIHWENPNKGATNSNGFTALPGGYRGHTDGAYDLMGIYGLWWSSTEYSSSHAWGHNLLYNNSDFFRYHGGKHYGFSVRLLRD